MLQKDQTVLVAVGFEGWLTWDYVVLWKGHSSAFLRSFIGLATPFTTYRGISGRDAAMSVRKQIDQALAKGKRVAAAALWTETPQTFVSGLGTVVDKDEARIHDALLRDSYRIGQPWKTPVGPFLELLPKPGEASKH